MSDERELPYECWPRYAQVVGVECLNFDLFDDDGECVVVDGRLSMFVLPFGEENGFDDDLFAAFPVAVSAEALLAEKEVGRG